MKKLTKIILILLFVITFLIGGAYIYYISAYPKKIVVSEIKVELTPQRIERGKYLANNVSGCIDCHSLRDYSKLAGPLIEGTEGQGGYEYPEFLGLPGKIITRNLTPYSLGTWSDGEIYRAITEGISKDGSVLFPLMPYKNFANLSKEDVYSIIAYIRTLKPIKNDVPKSEIKFPVNLLIRQVPDYANHQEVPDKNNTVEYGKYLTNAAGCTDCHTPAKDGEPIMEKYLSGGTTIELPDKTIIRPANITPDKNTGIGNWTKEFFIKKFKSFAKPEYSETPVSVGEFNTFMPWTFLSGMTEEDLGAIYDYLMSIKPIYNPVVKYEKVVK